MSCMHPKVNAIFKVITKYVHSAQSYLDIGCADGDLTVLVAKAVNADKVFGMDTDSKALQKAALKEVETYLCDVDKDIFPFENEKFDLITAFDVIEHLLNPDHMLREVKRCLKKKGFFLISTPSMASWYNRLLLLLGHPILGIDLSTEYSMSIL